MAPEEIHQPIAQADGILRLCENHIDQVYELSPCAFPVNTAPSESG